MKTVMLNPPAVMSLMFRLVKHVMPKKALDKVSVCPKDTFSEPIGTCPFAQAWWPAANIPDFLGGQYKVPEGHALYRETALPVEEAVSLTLLPKETRNFDITLGAETGKVQLQFTCLPHKFARNPGVEVSVNFTPLKVEDIANFDSGQVQDAIKSTNMSVTESRPLMPMEVVKTDAGRVCKEWDLCGPGIVECIVRNPSGGFPGTRKPLMYTLRMLKKRF